MFQKKVEIGLVLLLLIQFTLCQKTLMSEAELIEKLRQLGLTRGSGGIKGLGRTFRIMDDDDNRKLDFPEFRKGLHDTGVEVSPEEAQGMFAAIDKDGSGAIDFDEFLTSLRPSMGQSRKDIIDKAFKKFDKTGDGVVTVEDLRGVYNPREHKKYQDGSWTEQQVFEEYLKKFDSPNDPDGQITHEEFVTHYEGVSSNIADDAYFIQMIRNAWKI
ncbi:calcyphosin-like protein [Amphiura filiformis]|uniref:calcyphosin-like protein n=1 Tax=Amphiura filiformis TaxID=82378 RepID=UPI003B2167A4